MALIRRITRLFQADLHAVLDQLEEPDLLLHQTMREMEQLLAEDSHRLKLLLHEQRVLESREQEIRQSQNSFSNELDLCFENGRESLAKETIRRRLQAERMLQALTTRRDSVNRECNELCTAIEQNQSRLESIQHKAELLSVEKLQQPDENNWPTAEIEILERDVELELLREKQKRGLS